MKKFLWGLLFLVGCVSTHTPPAEAAVILRIRNEGFVPAVVYAIPCGDVTCRARLSNTIMQSTPVDVPVSDNRMYRPMQLLIMVQRGAEILRVDPINAPHGSLVSLYIGPTSAFLSLEGIP